MKEHPLEYEEQNRMDNNKGMTHIQWKDMLEILKNEDKNKEKAIQFIQSL